MSKLPNVLTVLRILLTLVFLAFIFKQGLLFKGFAFFIFVVASCTDFFDGYFAKKYNGVSNFGKLMDPVADKFLILSAFFVFTQMHLIALWMFGVIFLREVIITGVRLAAMRNGHILPAEKAGKYKTVSQIVAIYFILVFLILQEIHFFHATPSLFLGWQYGIQALMLIVVFSTLFSGIWYFWHYGRFIYVRQAY